MAHLFGGRELPIPVAVDTHLSIAGDRVTARRHGADPGELGLLMRPSETSGGTLQIPHGRHPESQQRLDLRGEEDIAVDGGVVERLDPEAVADRDHRALPFVGDDDRELAPQQRCGLGTALVIEVQSHFAVTVGGEAVSVGAQAFADLAISVELAVGDHVHHAVRAAHRLAAVVQADDRESRVPQCPLTVARRPCAHAVRPAMFETLQGGITMLAGKASPRHRRENSAHGSSCLKRAQPLRGGARWSAVGGCGRRRSWRAGC